MFKIATKYIENSNYSFHNFFKGKDCEIKKAAKTFNQSINIALIVPSKDLSTFNLTFFFEKGYPLGAACNPGLNFRQSHTMGRARRWSRHFIA